MQLTAVLKDSFMGDQVGWVGLQASTHSRAASWCCSVLLAVLNRISITSRQWIPTPGNLYEAVHLAASQPANSAYISGFERTLTPIPPGCPCLTTLQARTVMIANISPNNGSVEHTLNTLRYADRVKGRLGKPDLNSQECMQLHPAACRQGHEKADHRWGQLPSVMANAELP
jgi:hypothetical protein